MEPLKTLKGSKIWYSKFGVGKKMGSKIYAHINYGEEIICKETWQEAIKIWKDVFEDIYEINTFCYDTKTPYVVRFDTCYGFDKQECPIVGKVFYVDILHNKISFGFVNQIFHHKWLWVKPDYEGFDVKESYEFSKLWLSKFAEPASGYLHKWNEQLKKYNII